MNSVNYFDNLFESKPDYRKTVLIRFLNKNDVNLLYECGLLKGNIHYLFKTFENILLELNEEYLDYIKDQEKSIFEKILNKKMKHFSQICSKMLDMSDR